MNISNNLFTSYQDDLLDIDREYFISEIENCLDDFFQDKPLFSKDKYSLYYYDDIELGTQATSKTVSTLYLEINQPQNIREWKTKKDRHTYPDLYYKLNSIRDNLFDFFVKHFDNNTLLWKDEYAIYFSINIHNENDNTVRNVMFKIIPCITYTNENNVKGIMYFNEKSNYVIINYPHLAITNFKQKNKKCLGLFKPYCLVLKNIYKSIKNEKILPAEIFEILLYNVPNIFFENYKVENLKKIINYIRNSNIMNYKTLDEQDYAFVTAYRTLNIIYTKHAISKLSNYINKLND